MGIAANQARLMTLTARQNDLEYKAQRLSAIKMHLSQTTSELATNYANALNNYSKLNSAQQMGNQFADDWFIVNKDGSYSRYTGGFSQVAQAGNEANTTMTVPNDGNACQGRDLCARVASAIGATGDTLTITASGYLSYQQGIYQTETERLSAQEKIYDMELTQVNTEHDAIKTEYDAIKSLVGDNVEKTFNVFG